jgi:hypothetical protein
MHKTSSIHRVHKLAVLHAQNIIIYRVHAEALGFNPIACRTEAPNSAQKIGDPGTDHFAVRTRPGFCVETCVSLPGVRA